MGGYRSNDEANASAFTADGYFRTGDYGRRDKEGYLYLTGRIKEFINKGGEKIGPVELENVISTHPSVSEVVVFAIDDAMYGEEVGAAVRLKEGETVGARDLQKWIRQKVAPHRVPKQVRCNVVAPFLPASLLIACDCLLVSPSNFFDVNRCLANRYGSPPRYPKRLRASCRGVWWHRRCKKTPTPSCCPSSR